MIRINISQKFGRYAILQSSRCNLYLHKMDSGASDVGYHDHSWDYVSLVLWGGYTEETPEKTLHRGMGSLCFRTAESIHRLTVDKRGCITLCFTGAVRRKFKFY
jgi:hypothetical protein